jgi:hypothetical protein
MAGRPVDPEREDLWRRRFARWRASGQSARAFCAAEHIPESAWYFWRRQLRRREARARPRPARFVPVTVLPLPGVVEVRCPSGHVVTLPAGDPAALRQVFAALAGSASC